MRGYSTILHSTIFKQTDKHQTEKKLIIFMLLKLNNHQWSVFDTNWRPTLLVAATVQYEIGTLRSGVAVQRGNKNPLEISHI